MKSKRLVFVVLLVLSVCVMSGGCGGSGGGGESVSDNQFQTPTTPTPDPSTGSSFNSLSGKWEARSGEASLLGSSLTVSMSLAAVSADIRVISYSSSRATIEKTLFSYWRLTNIYDSSSGQADQVDGVHAAHTGSRNRASVTKTGLDEYQYTFADGSEFVVKVISSVLLFVEEKGVHTIENRQYRFRGSYYLEKVSN
jgi:hypothetical protein